MRRQNIVFPAVAGLMLLSGCGGHIPGLPSKDYIPFVHRVDVQQGNVITQDMLAQLHYGMERSKVRYIMGTPVIADTFHADRWDYIYTYQEGLSRREQRRISLYFKDDRLERVEGDVKAAVGRIKVERERSEMVEVPGEKEETLLGKLKNKVWSDEDKETAEDQVTTGGDAEAGADDAAEEPAADTEAKTAKNEEVVIPEDAPTRHKKGFFGRLLEKVGIGGEDKAGDRRRETYRDPTDTDASGPLRTGQ